MSESYRLVRPEERDGKTYWNEVGVMFPKDDGSFFLKLHLFGDAVFRAFPQESHKDEAPKHPPQKPPKR